MVGKKTGAILIIVVIMLFLCRQYAARTPETAIRLHLFLNNPKQSLTCDIDKTCYIDKTYGQQYIIKGFVDSGSGNENCFAYVKKNNLGSYYWTGGGSGP